MFDVFYLGKKPGLFVHECAVDSINLAHQRSHTRYFWVVNYLADYSSFDFLWEPPPWQAHQRHAWASQWQKDSGTYLVPRSGYQDTNYHPEQITMTADPELWSNANDVENFDFSWHPDFADPAFDYEFGTQWQKTGGPLYTMPGATHTKYVSQSGSKICAQAHDTLLVDHMDGNADKFLRPVVKRARYFASYKNTLTRLVNNVDHDLEFVWICSSICNYDNFDFSWHPEAWQSHMLHVFPSDDQKFGDTFFMHVPTFRAKIDKFELLEWYDLNFVTQLTVPRYPMPVIRHRHDSQVEAVKQFEWQGPLALFACGDMDIASVPAVALWEESTKTVMPLDAGANTVIMPKNAVPRIRTQVYDYPWIDRSRKSTLQCAPLDIVFISNGEPGAEHNHDVLQQCLAQHQATNVVHRVTDVQGRVACYQAAARASGTDWFFTVFAKLQVNEDFDWAWQPDRLQEAKHYIFHAYNPVNHLVYGHQALIVYNRRLVLANPGRGLDFTLDNLHEVVPILSGTAYYDSDAWTCWRTAFREVLKLRHSLPDVENQYRLEQWLEPNNHDDYARWSHIGANDASRYYESVSGDFASLKKSYDWQWLATYAMLVQPSLIIKT